MKIGVDLDGVILDSEILFRIEAEIFDEDVLNKNSLVKRNEILIEDRYNWSKEERKRFQPYLRKVAMDANLAPGAKEIINLLKLMGHEIILISSRGDTDSIMQEIGKESLRKYDIFLDKYYFAVKDKLQVCKKENIDIMIDDNYIKCLDVSKGGIFTLYFADSGMKLVEENDKLKIVYNWGEIYRVIKNKQKGK